MILKKHLTLPSGHPQAAPPRQILLQSLGSLAKRSIIETRCLFTAMRADGDFGICGGGDGAALAYSVDGTSLGR